MKKAIKMSAENSLSEAINQAYINIVGKDKANAKDCSDTYEGEYGNNKEFAQNKARQMGLLNRDMAWPYNCIDWDSASIELMIKYTVDSNYYFRNL